MNTKPPLLQTVLLGGLVATTPVQKSGGAGSIPAGEHNFRRWPSVVMPDWFVVYAANAAVAAMKIPLIPT